MPCKTKRQQQVSKLFRKKGCYVSQEITRETEEIVESEEADKTVDKAVRMEVETVEEGEAVDYWTEEDLREFEKAESRLITEALHWHEDATSSIRAAYIKASRTTIWKHKNKKKELEYDAMGMKQIDAFFRSTEASTSMFSLQSSQLSLETTQNSSLISIEITKNLQVRLEEVNKQCSISQSAKTKNNTFTYYYLCHLSIRRYIQLLLDGQGKMNASNQIAQTMWSKGDYM